MAAEQRTPTVVKFPTSRKRAYANPLVRELPSNVVRLPVPTEAAPDFPLVYFGKLMFYALDHTSRAALIKAVSAHLLVNPDNADALAMKEWVSRLPWRPS